MHSANVLLKMKRSVISCVLFLCVLTCAACSGNSGQKHGGHEGFSQPSEDETSHILPDPEAQLKGENAGSEESEMSMRMKIGDTAVDVVWENNESVEALKALCRDEPLTIQMSMYGGFEQVGSIGTSLPTKDEKTATQAGDIVLYAGNQLVVFYGSNSWAYTRLGRVVNQDAQGMEALLGNGDVTITIAPEKDR